MQEWDREWQLLVNSADMQRQAPPTSAQLPYDFLDQFHVFVLANMLRRPIIIVGEPYLCSMTGDSIQPNDFVGIYLPLLWSSFSCLQMPIVLAFLMDHFLPLAARSTHSSSSAWAVPLVTSLMEPLRVHFLLPDEESGAHLLLQQYLELLELEADGDNGCDAVLAAKIAPDDMTSDSRRRPKATLRQVLFRGRDLFPKCTTQNCEFPAFASTTGVCLICSLGSFPYQTYLEEGSLVVDGTTLPKCANVGCVNDSWMPYGGLCRLCSTGVYPRHYDMSLRAFIREFRYGLTKSGMYSSEIFTSIELS